MKRPPVVFALTLSLGILIASKVKIPLSLLYPFLIIFLMLSFLSFKKRLMFDISVSCLIFTLGAACLKNSQILPKHHISKYVYPQIKNFGVGVYYKNAQAYIVRGFIGNDPLVRNNKTTFIFKTQAIKFGNESLACSGEILVYLRGGNNLSYGEELILRGNLYRPFNRQNSRGQSYRNYLYNQGIWFIMNVKTQADVIKLDNNKGFIIKRFALELKQKMEEVIFRHTSSLTAAILDAMILGEKKNIPWFVNNAMMKSGTIHILVVSGFNVGIVSFIIVLFLKLLRLHRKIRLCIAIVCLMIYCLLTGASTPVVRATVMGIVFMLGLLLKREPDIYNSCAAALIFILVVNPRQLFDIGFQLSFASVISIVYLYPKLKLLLGTEFLQIKYLKFLLDGCLVSFSAWIATSGFIAYYFKLFSPVTILANILIVPLATLITVCGFSLILISLVFPLLSPFFALTCELLVLVLLKVNAFFLSLPAAYLYLP